MGKGTMLRRDCRFDHFVRAAMSQSYGQVLILKGIGTWERADDIRRGIYRCSKHRHLTAEAGPSRIVDGDDQMGVRKTGKTYELRFRLWSKTEGRRRHLERYGTDRSQWPYDPRRPATDDELPRDEQGNVVRGNWKHS